VILIARSFVRKIAMLLLPVMLFAPVIDAFACTAEISAVHLAGDTALDPPAEDVLSDEQSHGACGHNHCHHTVAHIAALVAFADGAGKGRVPPARHDVDRISNVSDGLLRPPRI
jgi:hypothetical protein